MATQVTKKAAPAASPAKAKKTAVKRTAEQLKGTLKGRLFLLARVAFNVINKATKKSKNDAYGTFAGVARLGEVSYPNGTFYAATKEGAPYWNLPEDGEVFKKIRSAGKAAQADIAAGKNTPAAQKFLGEIVSVAGEGGARSYNTAQVADLDL